MNPAVEGSEPSGHPNASVTRDGMGAVRKIVAFGMAGSIPAAGTQALVVERTEQ